MIKRGMKIYLYRNECVGKVPRKRGWGWPILHDNKGSVLYVLIDDWSSWENSLEYKDFGKWKNTNNGDINIDIKITEISEKE